MKIACVLTNGCPENRIDAACMQELLKKKGWSISDNPSNSDLILFNACGLTKQMEDSGIRFINHLKSKQKSGSRLIVCGCLPRINPERLRSVYSDFTFGSDDIDALAAFIDEEAPVSNAFSNYLVPIAKFSLGMRLNVNLHKVNLSPYYFLSRLLAREHKKYSNLVNVVGPDTYYIKVSTGCLNSCSYCAVKISRGALRSKPIENIVEEFKAGLEQNYKRFALIGSDVGCYGRDQKTNLVQLLNKLVELPGDFEICIRNFHPRFLIDMLPELMKVCKSGKIGYMSSAAQSGNNRILKLMQRGYRIEEYKHAVNSLKKEFPHFKVRTQLMVGFPGETESEFEDTLRLIDEVDFDFIELYKFSPRPGTKAESLPGAIPAAVIHKRYYRILRKTLHHLRHKYSSTN